MMYDANIRRHAQSIETYRRRNGHEPYARYQVLNVAGKMGLRGQEAQNVADCFLDMTANLNPVGRPFPLVTGALLTVAIIGGAVLLSKATKKSDVWESTSARLEPGHRYRVAAQITSHDMFEVHGVKVIDGGFQNHAQYPHPLIPADWKSRVPEGFWYFELEVSEVVQLPEGTRVWIKR